MKAMYVVPQFWETVEKVCAGKCERFREQPCVHFVPSQEECKLLKNKDYDSFWNGCRGDPWQRFIKLYNLCTESERQSSGSFVNTTRDPDLGIIYEKVRCENLVLKKNTFGNYFNYIRKTIHNTVLNDLGRSGLYGKKKCSSCMDLPGSKPYICQCKTSLNYGKKRYKTDSACASYSFRKPKTIPIGHFGERGTITETEATIKATNIQEPILESSNAEVQKIRKALRGRVEETRSETKKRKIYERHCREIEYCLELYSDEIPDKEVMKIIANRERVSVKTVREDLKEIRKYLMTNLL